MALVKSTTYAPDIFKALDGVLLVYKPPKLTLREFSRELRFRITDQLNQYKPRPISNQLVIAGDVEEDKKLVEVPNLADHPLVVGPRYQPWDLRIRMVEPWLGINSSGLVTVLFGSANRYFGLKMKQSRLVSIYHISGRLGYITDNYWSDGRILDKSTYKHIRPGRMDAVLARVESSQYERLFDSAAVPLHSPQAYELAKSWPSRPPRMANWPVIYRARCIHLNPPEFKLELTVTNENEAFLAQFCHDVGLMLKSGAHTESIRRVRMGPFDVKDCLTVQEWDLQRIIDKLAASQRNHVSLLSHLDTYRSDHSIKLEHKQELVSAAQ